MTTRAASAAMILAIAAGACSHDAAEPGARRGDAAAARPSVAPALPRPPAQTEAQAREAAVTFRKALFEGRRLSHQKQYPQAIEAFERAVAANGQDPRARCELGWAAFQANDLDVATASLDQALSILERLAGRGLEDRERNVYAGCLYNRGRVAEARGDAALAATLYRGSLALRPNDTVQARLDGLGAAAAAASSPPAEPPRNCWVGDCEPVTAATLEELERELARRHCGFTGAARCSAGGQSVTIDGGAGGVSGAALVTTNSFTPEWGDEHRGWVAIRTASGWHGLGELAYTLASGVGGTSCDLRPEALRFVQAIEGGPPELWVEVTDSMSDADMGVNELWRRDHRWMTICGLDGERPACFGRIPVASEEVTEAMTPVEELSAEERASIREVTGADSPATRRTAWSIRVELVPPDRVRLVRADGAPPAELLLEERPVRELRSLRGEPAAPPT